MLDVISCIVGKHNLWFVLLAALICALSAVTALQAYARAVRTTGRARGYWLTAAGAVGGAGIWATHFVAMLAFSPSLPIQYDVPITVLSLLIGMIGAGLGFGVAAAGEERPLLGGALIGASIVAMHYTGVIAIRAAFDLHWNLGFVAASVVISLGLAAAALWAQRRWQGSEGRAGAVFLLIVAIVGLHFTGMTALTIVPDLSAPVSPEEVSRPVLAAVVGGVVLLILATSAALVVIEAQSRRSSLGAMRLAFQGVPSAIALYDGSKKLVLWNEAFENLMASFYVVPAVGMDKMVLMRATLPG